MTGVRMALRAARRRAEPQFGHPRIMTAVRREGPGAASSRCVAVAGMLSTTELGFEVLWLSNGHAQTQGPGRTRKFNYRNS